MYQSSVLHLACPICMETFNDPVTTSCGHSFCMRCLELSISSFQIDYACPLCKTHLRKAPKVNNVLRDIVQEVKNTLSQTFTGAAGEVRCDACTVPKKKAEKSCLVCLASFCSTHLENHYSAKRLKGHKLTSLYSDETQIIDMMAQNQIFSSQNLRDSQSLKVHFTFFSHAVSKTVDLFLKNACSFSDFGFPVDVRLDPDTAHRRLVFSDDRSKVKDGGENQEAADSPKRYDVLGSVLGLNTLATGKSYWEMEVGSTTGWDLGVARGSANRRGRPALNPDNGYWVLVHFEECDVPKPFTAYAAMTAPPVSLSFKDKPKKIGVADHKGKLTLSPDNGYWVLVHYEAENYAAMTAPPTRVSLERKPSKVGVFVDQEEGLVSFYDVTARSHIYSFTECSFRDEIYPYFSPHYKQGEMNSEALVISSGHHSETD
uniref:Uncharacterized protein n=1 Tax=Xiphophorus couchianus TaxID=32473 RepID=A0A3B5L6W9_9TELE